ncbi:GNAT family N-acetyltransferase [Paenibacillus lignilyticus]|uniref:GNAT family N-acetyltransferase n=1 Tax=Paenibacillus lignilyticus TaxID=1172615 RepID=A0ABS5C971_9BACL|nr:GNAT family N-acetyltransferase [Paenibacillus lignilyticus]MBP3962552.1 GNAT family N-acetyltransferase [Paenibacillus lignilyticus]
MNQERLLPQLVMVRERLSDLPELMLPPGYELRSYQPGDDSHWEQIVQLAFGWHKDFRKGIKEHPFFKPERVLFICYNDMPVATACAWHEEKFGEHLGYLHMVGVDPAHSGKGLGYSISLAALRQMSSEGLERAVLETDDFRLSAIKIYVKLGFKAIYIHDNQAGRWSQLYPQLNPQKAKFNVAGHSRPGGTNLNEDALVINNDSQVYGVIDGVSSMAAYKDTQGHTGGYLAAQLLASELNAHDPHLDLKQAVLAANRKLNESMVEADIDLTCKWKRWGAVFAIVRIHETHIEYVQTGDCMLFIAYSDESIQVLTRNQVAGFDQMTLNKKKELSDSGLSKEQVSEGLYPFSIANRNKANTPEGYSVMNGEPELELYIEHGSISRANVSKIYAVSDGMFHLIEHSDDPKKWETLLRFLNAMGIEPYMDHLTCSENQDPQCEHYPRHKKSDDKSAMIIDFNNNA